MKIFCLDTETTAGMKDGRVVQFAIVDKDFQGEWLVKPPTKILPGTIKVHKITPDIVKDKPNFKKTEGYKELKKRLDNGEFLIAHHARFDLSILANEGVQVKNYICSCKVARKILKPEGVPKFGLQFLKEYLRLEEIYADKPLRGYAHSALYDTTVLYRLYLYLYKKIEDKYPGEDPHQVMLDISNETYIEKTFRFGKYKGKTFKSISKVDKAYLIWLYNAEKNNPVPRKGLLQGLEIYINT